MQLTSKPSFYSEDSKAELLLRMKSDFYPPEKVTKDSFKEFLQTSPYASGEKYKTKFSKEILGDIKKKDLRKELNQFLAYYGAEEEKKTIEIERLTPIENKQENPQIEDMPAPEDLSVRSPVVNSVLLRSPSPEVKAIETNEYVPELILTPKTNEKIYVKESITGHMREHSVHNLDKNVKKLIEGLQARITKLETEAENLRKENSETAEQNKKMENQIASFKNEQANFTRIKADYETRIRRLQDYVKNNDDTFRALKTILTLQEEELANKGPKKVALPELEKKPSKTDSKGPLSKLGTTTLEKKASSNLGSPLSVKKK